MTRRTTTLLGRAARATAATLVLAAPYLASAATDLGKVTPKDAVFALWTNDYTALRTGIDASPFGKLWNDPATDKLRAWSEKKFAELESKAIAEADMKFADLLGALKGGIAVYGKMQGDAGDFEKDIRIVAIVETDEAGKAFFKARMEKGAESLKDVKKSTFDFAGATVFTIAGTGEPEEKSEGDESSEPTPSTTTGNPEAFQYTFLDKFFIVSSGTEQDAIKEAINRVKASSADGGVAGRLSGTSVAKQFGTAAGQVNGFFAMGDAIQKGVKKDPPEDPAMLEVIPKTGLYDFKDLYFGATPSAKSVDMEFAMTMASPKNGIVDALYKAGPVTLEKAAWAPANANSVSVFSFDMGLFYDAVIAIMDQASPGMSGIVKLQLGQMQAQYKVDFVNGILKNISGAHVVVQRELDPEMKAQLKDETAKLQGSTAIYFGIKNGDETLGTIKTLVEELKKSPDFGGAIESSDKDGILVIGIKAGGEDSNPLKPGLAVSNKAIVFANNATELQEAIRALQGKSASSLSSAAGFKAATANLAKENLYAFSYTPKEAMGRSLEGLRKVLESGMVDGLADEGFTADMIPPAAVFEKYFGDASSAMYLRDDAVYGYSRTSSAN